MTMRQEFIEEVSAFQTVLFLLTNICCGTADIQFHWQQAWIYWIRERHHFKIWCAKDLAKGSARRCDDDAGMGGKHSFVVYDSYKYFLSVSLHLPFWFSKVVMYAIESIGVNFWSANMNHFSSGMAEAKWRRGNTGIGEFHLCIYAYHRVSRFTKYILYEERRMFNGRIGKVTFEIPPIFY